MPPSASSRKNARECNIQVAVRCRPLNTKEKNENSPSIIECAPQAGKLTVKGLKYDSKTFSYDHVFAPDTTQVDVYKTLVEPQLDEVLTGFNCTVFAYGQTGTGKTHTMEGCRSSDVVTVDDPGLGLIPRAMYQLFEKLEQTTNEYSVRVSFLEIYNEELFDLLSPLDQHRKLRLFEDSRNKGSVVIQNLEEVVVHNASEVFSLIQRGAEKRRTSETKMNKTSSRSHSVFSVTVHQKESSMTGEELLKTGKLYLVDLAGSENIGRSGAVRDRAREAGNINQSLLTLGRVIQKLVQKEQHIPYRESKLTRLLQDSLGGRTKTSIVATISPAMCNLEETLSTLDYALHAKNIKNRPEINEKLTKKALIKEYTDEIEKLKRDLLATRSKNGVYVDQDNYEAMQATMKEQEDKITILEQELAKTMELFDTTSKELKSTKEELEERTTALHQTKQNLEATTEELKERTLERDQTQFIVDAHVTTEQELTSQAQDLISVAETTTSHVDGLHGKIERKTAVERHNEAVLAKLKEETTSAIGGVKNNIQGFADAQGRQMEQLMSNLNAFVSAASQHLEATKQQVEEINGSLHSKVMSGATDAMHGLTQQGQEAAKACTQAAASGFDALKQSNVAFDNQFQQDMERLQQLVAQQQEAFACFASTMSGQVQSMYESAQGFASQQQQELKEHEERLSRAMETAEKDASSIGGRMAGFASNLQDEVSQEVDNAKAGIAQILQQLVTSVGRKTQTASDLASEMNAFTASLGDQRNELVSGLQGSQTAVSAFATQLSQQQEVQQEETAQATQDYEVRSEEVGNGCEAMGAHVAEAIRATSAAVQERSSAVEGEFARRAEQLAHARTQAEEEVQGAVSVAATECAHARDAVVHFVGEVDSFGQGQEQALQGSRDAASAHTERVQQNLASIQDGIAQVVNSEIRKDVPTGTTPAKQVYTYPRSLAATRPHDDLTREFTRMLSSVAEDEHEEEQEEQGGGSEAQEDSSREGSAAGQDQFQEEAENEDAVATETAGADGAMQKNNLNSASMKKSKLVQPGSVARKPFGSVN